MRLPKETNSNIIRLDKNECICPSFIKDLLSRAGVQEDDYFRYRSSLEIESALCRYFNCKVDNIYTDNGSEQVLKNLINILDCNRWVLTSPTFEMFPVYCTLFKKEVVFLPFKYNNNSFYIDYLKGESKDSGLYIVSPHNPTGYITSLEELIDLSVNYKYVIIDQAYISPIEELNVNKLPANVIVVRTFSKMGGLTGMRFGFCITPNIKIVAKLNNLRPMYLNSLTLKLVETILKFPYTLEKISSEFKEVKKLLTLPVIAESGNFILLKDITRYKNYKLKEYNFDNNKFYRMTLFDTETFYKL